MSKRNNEDINDIRSRLQQTLVKISPSIQLSNNIFTQFESIQFVELLLAIEGEFNIRIAPIELLFENQLEFNRLLEIVVQKISIRAKEI